MESTVKRWRDSRSGRDVWLLTAATVDEWPEVRPWPSERFALLVATDHLIDVHRLAPRALAQGLAAVAAWGPNCAAIETQFDDAIVGDGSNVETVDNVILTTSHVEDSLDEALEFFLDVLFPATDHVDKCATWVVFALGDLASRIGDSLDRRGAHQ